MSRRKRSSHLAVGRIIGVHGIRGEMKVNVMTDFPERFEPGSMLWIEGESTPREILSVREHKGNLLVRMAGLATRTEAELMRQRYLLIERSQAMPLPENEFYEDELLGLRVVTTTGILLGELVEVLQTGANDVYIVEGDLGEVLLPAIADVVQSVDLQKEEMVVKLLPGLVPALDEPA
ncbi:MAG: 16S rRNA processing protein RimM [Chloroflexi bacterium]|nr:16S rRNA processing protein RimM [Chloroflexota bacterium]